MWRFSVDIISRLLPSSSGVTFVSKFLPKMNNFGNFLHGDSYFDDALGASGFRAVSEQFRSSFRAVSGPCRAGCGSCYTGSVNRNRFRLYSTGKWRAVTEQCRVMCGSYFTGKLGAVSEQLLSSCRAMTGWLRITFHWECQCVSRAVSEPFPIAFHWQIQSYFRSYFTQNAFSAVAEQFQCSCSRFPLDFISNWNSFHFFFFIDFRFIISIFYLKRRILLGFLGMLGVSRYNIRRFSSTSCWGHWPPDGAGADETVGARCTFTSCHLLYQLKKAANSRRLKHENNQ